MANCVPEKPKQIVHRISQQQVEVYNTVRPNVAGNRRVLIQNPTEDRQQFLKTVFRFCDGTF